MQRLQPSVCPSFSLYPVISDWSFVWIQKHKDQATATTTIIILYSVLRQTHILFKSGFSRNIILPFYSLFIYYYNFLYGCEAWSLTLREEHTNS